MFPYCLANSNVICLKITKCRPFRYKCSFLYDLLSNDYDL